MEKDVWVIIPCLNEEIAIQNTIREIRSFLPLATIVVIDNGSSDRTVEVAASEGVTVWHEPLKGKGYAVRHGFARLPITCHTIFMIDGDDTYSVAPVLEALRLIRFSGFDMVVGKRVAVKQDEVDRGRIYRLGHDFGNRFLTKVFQILFPIPIEDTLSGWRVMSRGFVMSFAGGASGFEIEAELNAHAFLLKCPVGEVLVPYRGRGDNSFSKLRTYRDGFRILRKNLRLFRSERPYLAFLITASPWALLSIVLLARSLGDYFRIGLVPHFPSLIASVGSFLLAVLLWVAGMILERVRISREAMARYVYNSSFH